MKILIFILLLCLFSGISVQAQLPSERAFSLEKALAYKKDKQVNPSQTILTSLPSESIDWNNRVEKIKARFHTVSSYQEPKLTSLPSTRKTDFDAIIRKYKKI